MCRDQIARLAVIFLLSFLLLGYGLGYHMLSRVLYCILVHSYAIFLAFSVDGLLSGLIATICKRLSQLRRVGLTFITRNHFVFEPAVKRSITFATVLALIAFVTYYSWCCAPASGLVISLSSLRRNFAYGSIVIIASMACELLFDSVLLSVYEETKKYSDAVKKATEDKEDFFATMSHEIRNPLQSLLGSVELLQTCDSSQHPTLAGIIKNCCESVLNLVSNILDASKIEAKKLEISPIPSSLPENISKVLRVSQARAKAKGIMLSYKESGPIPTVVMFDPQKVHQVVVNLVSNAIKFTPEKGKVVALASWFPVTPGESAGSIMKREGHSSSWNQVMDPMKELEGEEESAWKKFSSMSPSAITILVGNVVSRRGASQASFAMTCRNSLGGGELRRMTSANKERMMELGSDSGAHEELLSSRVESQGANSAVMPSNPVLSNPALNCSSFPLPSTFAGAVSGSASALTKLHSTTEPRPVVVPGVIKIEVLDTGIGIEKAAAARLFQRYQQADSTISQYQSIVAHPR